MNPKIKILHYCEKSLGTSYFRSIALVSNFNFITKILWHTDTENNKSIVFKYINAFFHKLKIPRDIYNANEKLLNECLINNYDIILIEKCLALKKNTLRKIKKNHPESKLILYILDDYLGHGNVSKYFIGAIPFYDLIATNKRHNILDFYNHGAKKVYYFRNGYSFVYHRPILQDNILDSNLESHVTFVGSFETCRSEYLIYLAENGIKINVYGWGYNSFDTGINHPNIINWNKHVYLYEFAKVISSSKINLNFLRKSNKDTETTRTAEIPACGGFMISERSVEQKEMFKEGIEAEYFGSKEELLAKINYYLKNPNERLKIAINGRIKCMILNLCYEKQIEQIINNSFK